MLKRASNPVRSIMWLPIACITWMRAFFFKLRSVDVDEVGKAIFRHCTSPKALYVTLFERWWIVAICAIAGIGLGVHTIKSAVESYETHGSILIYQKLPTFMDDKVMIPDPKAYDALFATHVNLISSQMIVEKAIEEFELEERCPKIFDELEEDATFLTYVRSNLKVARAGSGDSAGAFVITVGFGHTSEEECPLVVDAVLDTYREHVNSSLLFDQQRTVELSLKNVERLEAEVDERNQALREYVKTAPGIWNRMTENNPYQVRVESLESEMTALRTREVSLESRLTIMAQTHDALTGRVLSDLERLALIDQAHIGRLDMLVRVKEKHISIESQADYPQLQEFEKARFDKLLGLQSERAELRKNIGENHPDIIDIDAQINEIQKQLDTLRESVTDSSNISPQELVDSYIRMLEKELADTIIKIEFIKNEIETAVHQAQELTDFTIKAKHLEKQYDQSLEMYQAAANRSTKESMLSEFGNFVSEIVARPHHCELTWPKKPVILALCMILGIFAGSFISIALDLVAYSPLRRVFWFLPGWLLGGKSYEQVLKQADEAKRNSLQRSRTAESPEPANAPAALRSTEPPQSQPSPHSEGENGDE